MEFQAVLDAVRALPFNDRVRLVDLIHEEMESPVTDHGLSDAQVREIRRRVAAHEADPSSGILWEEFEANIEKHLQELGE